jgi:hypothetical protein
MTQVGRKRLNLAIFSYFVALLTWALLSTSQLCLLHVQKWPLCCDFVKFYAAGTMASEAKRISIYDANTQFAFMNSLIAPARTDSVFLHLPPTTFLFMLPWTLLPMPASFALWSALGLIVGLFAIWQLVILFASQYQIKIFFGLAVLSLASEPALHNFWFGQFAWFYLALLCAVFKTLATNRQLAFGFCTALLLAMKPQYGLFFLPALIIKGRLKGVIGFGVSGFIFLGLAIAILGWENVIAYPTSLRYGEALGGEVSGLGANYLVGMRGIFNRFLSQPMSLEMASGAAGLSLPFVFLTWRKAAKRGDLYSFAFAAALTCLLAIMVGLHTREYDLLLLMFPAALTLSSPTQIEESWQHFWYRIWFVLLFLFPLLSLVIFFVAYPLGIFSQAMTVYVLLLLVAGNAHFWLEESSCSVKTKHELSEPK